MKWYYFAAVHAVLCISIGIAKGEANVARHGVLYKSTQTNILIVICLIVASAIFIGWKFALLMSLLTLVWMWPSAFLSEQFYKEKAETEPGTNNNPWTLTVAECRALIQVIDKILASPDDDSTWRTVKTTYHAVKQVLAPAGRRIKPTMKSGLIIQGFNDMESSNIGQVLWKFVSDHSDDVRYRAGFSMIWRSRGYLQTAKETLLTRIGTPTVCKNCSKPVVESRKAGGFRRFTDDGHYLYAIELGICLQCFEKDPESWQKIGKRWQ